MAAVSLTYSFGSGTQFDKLFATQLQADLTSLSNIPDTASTWTVTQTFTGSAAIAAADGTVGAPSITLGSDLDSGFYKKAANSIAMSLGGADVVVMSTTTASFVGAVSMTNGLTVSGGAVTLPAGSIANAALATPSGVVQIQTILASATAQIDFTTGLDDTYDQYLILADLTVLTDGVHVILRLATSGPTWKSGASDYDWGMSEQSVSGTNHRGDAADSGISLTGNTNTVGASAGEYFCGTVCFSNPEANMFPLFSWTARWLNTSSATLAAIGGVGRYIIGTTAFVGVRLTPSSGNVTGRATLYGFAKA